MQVDEQMIRNALNLQAQRYDPPGDLSERTMARVRELGPARVRNRLRRWRDARGAARVKGPGRLAWAGAVVVAALASLAVGSMVARGPSGPPVPDALTATTQATTSAQVAPSGAAPPDQAGSGERGGAVEDSKTRGGVPVPPDIAFPPPGVPGSLPPKLATNAGIEIKVPKGRFEQAWSQAQSVAGQAGGFVVSVSSEQQNRSISRGTLTLRVPASKLDAAVALLRKLGTVASYRTNATDVSGQIADYEARLRSLRAQEAQLLELLKRAAGVSDILQIRTRLDETRTQIEQLQAAQQGVQSQVDYSTLSVTMFEPDGEPREPGRFDDAWKQVAQIILTVVIGFVVIAGTLAPFVIVGLIIWLIARRARRST